MKGKIIVIEGTDCSGKETQTSLLVQRLKKEGFKVERFSFPMYNSPTGKIIGGPFLGNEYIEKTYFKESASKVDPKVAALYFAADRKYNINMINNLLDEGINVILDRYVESNMGCQAGKILDKEERLKLYKWLEDLEYGLLELPRPDLTIFLWMPYDKVLELKSLRSGKSDKQENESIFIKNSENAYLELANMHDYKKIVCVEDNNKLRTIENIHEEIYKIVKEKL